MHRDEHDQGDFLGPVRLPARPTDALPGSVEKIAVLMTRVARREALHHPLDANPAGRPVQVGFLAPAPEDRPPPSPVRAEDLAVTADEIAAAAGKSRDGVARRLAELNPVGRRKGRGRPLLYLAAEVAALLDDRCLRFNRDDFLERLQCRS